MVVGFRLWFVVRHGRGASGGFGLIEIVVGIFCRHTAPTQNAKRAGGLSARRESMTTWYERGLRFACKGCGACCAGAPGYVWVTKAEAAIMAAALGVPGDAFAEKYTRVIGRRRSLRERANGDCTLLRSGECAVYHVRPHQCRTWPFWPENLTSRARWRSLGENCPGIGRGAIHSLEDITRVLASRRPYNKVTRVFAKLLAIYAQCEEIAACEGARCKACGRCCRFSEHGHDLYVSSLEAAWMLFAGGRPRALRRGECPYLDHGRCANRTGRALGCRTYFCEGDDESAREVHETMLGRIKKLSVEAEIPWHYDRIDRALRAAADDGQERAPVFSYF